MCAISFSTSGTRRTQAQGENKKKRSRQGNEWQGDVGQNTCSELYVTGCMKGMSLASEKVAKNWNSFVTPPHLPQPTQPTPPNPPHPTPPHLPHLPHPISFPELVATICTLKASGVPYATHTARALGQRPRRCRAGNPHFVGFCSMRLPFKTFTSDKLQKKGGSLGGFDQSHRRKRATFV